VTGKRPPPPVSGEDRLREAAAIVREARSIMVLTGAGVSAESGVPTFRDAQKGLWARYDPQMLTSAAGFAADPGLVWRWYMERFGGVSRVHPNPGHVALAQLEALSTSSTRPFGFSLFTQNVDDLHERAGSRSVHHLHGSIHRYRCHECGEPYLLSSAERERPEPPRCTRCSGLVRPDVVWFGEPLPIETLALAHRSAETCDLILVVGTSGQVYPAALIPDLARSHGASVIDVNPLPTTISRSANVFLRGASGAVLPRLVHRVAEGIA
jgi:NAD-dependent deacetylase